MATRAPHRQAALRSRLSGIFFSPRGFNMGNNSTANRSRSSREPSPLDSSLISTSSPPTPSSPASNDENTKPYRQSFRKARKLSRVFTEFSLLDSMTSRKSTDNLKAQRPPSQRPSTSAGPARETIFEGRSARSLDGRPSQAAPPSPSPVQSGVKTASSTTISTTPRVSVEKILQSSNQPNTSTTPHNISTSYPEDIPLPPSRPGSSRGGAMLLKRQRKSLELRSMDEFGFRTALSPRSKSLRVSGSTRPTPSKMSAPSGESSPDVRDPLQPARNHYVEVKRARKMTQLFGQELPPELIRVLDERRNAERTQPNSTASSLPDSDPAPPTLPVENGVDPAEDGEDLGFPSSLETLDGEFQERRRRVAKLTQFFGVKHAEIASSLVFTKPSESRSAPLSDITHRPPPIPYGEPVEVGVKVVSRRRWGLGEDMRDVELSDAINKLRCLKA